MDKQALRMKLHEINKAVCLQSIDQVLFDELESDIENHMKWHTLLMYMEGCICDPTYMDLAEQCVKACARKSIGDKTE